MPYQPSSSIPVAMPILNVHTVILTFGKMRLSLSPLTGQQYILLKNPGQYLEEEEEAERSSITKSTVILLNTMEHSSDWGWTCI